MRKSFQKKLWLSFNLPILALVLLCAPLYGDEEAPRLKKEELSLKVLKDLKKIRESPSEFKLGFSSPYLSDRSDFVVTLGAEKLGVPISGKGVLISSSDVGGSFSGCQSVGVEEATVVCRTETAKEEASVLFHPSAGADRLVGFDVYFLEGRTGYVQHMQERFFPYFSMPLFYASSSFLGLFFLFFLGAAAWRGKSFSLSPRFSSNLYYYPLWFKKNPQMKEAIEIFSVFLILYGLWLVPLGRTLHFYLLFLGLVFFLLQPFLRDRAFYETASFVAFILFLWSFSAVYLDHYQTLLPSRYFPPFLIALFFLSPLTSLFFAALFATRSLLPFSYYHGVFLAVVVLYGLTFFEKRYAFFKRAFSSFKGVLLRKN